MKLLKKDGFNVSAFITEEIEPVLQKVDTDFSRWVNSVSKWIKIIQEIGHDWSSLFIFISNILTYNITIILP